MTSNSSSGGTCPFSSRKGYTTKETRQEYLKNSHHFKKIQDYNESLEADLNDTTKPLFFWQIHSLWGRQPILDICTDFYNSVYNNDSPGDTDDDDDDLLFKQVFQRVASKEHHIYTQAGYWIDAFGGGKLYHGGIGRLSFHHYYNAKPIMNAKGAKKWMYHMKIAIQKNSHHFEKDPRILKCLVKDFLETKMRSYATEFEWEFDESDFHLQDFVPPSRST